MSSEHVEVYERLRPLLFALAYRMLGDVGEAEDVVQEAYLRYQRTVAEGTAIGAPRAFLTTVTTRLAIDTVRSARARHEAYVGVWLPEPFAVTLDADPAERAEMNASLSLAFLVLLQTLSPLERAVFVLREAFDYGYDEIAQIVQKREATCRQIFARARKRLDGRIPRFDAQPQEQQELARRFFAAAQTGDLPQLIAFLAPEATFYGDGGGKARAYPQPLSGRDRVARAVTSLFKAARTFRITLRFGLVNGQAGALAFDAEGRLISVLVLDVTGGVIQAVRSIVNPDKLTHLGFPVSPLARLPGS